MPRKYIGLSSSGPLYDYKMTAVASGLRCRHDIVMMYVFLCISKDTFLRSPQQTFSHFLSAPNGQTFLLKQLEGKWGFHDWLSLTKIYSWSWGQGHISLIFKGWIKWGRAFYQLVLTLCTSSQILSLLYHHISPAGFYINIWPGIKPQDFFLPFYVSM